MESSVWRTVQSRLTAARASDSVVEDHSPYKRTVTGHSSSVMVHHLKDWCHYPHIRLSGCQASSGLMKSFLADPEVNSQSEVVNQQWVSIWTGGADKSAIPLLLETSSDSKYIFVALILQSNFKMLCFYIDSVLVFWCSRPSLQLMRLFTPTGPLISRQGVLIWIWNTSMFRR